MSLLFHSRAKTEDGKYLSNFTPCNIAFQGMIFPSIEHAFQGAKALFLKKSVRSPEYYLQKFSLDGEWGKLEARLVKGKGSKTSMMKIWTAELDCEKWNANSVSIMKDLVKLRMEVDRKYADIIIETILRGVELRHFERPPREKRVPFWGGYVDKKGVWVGENKLGIIMQDIFV